MRASDEAAFRDFVQRHGAALRNVAFGLCADWHAADDVLQITLIKLYVSWPKVRRADNPWAFAKTVLVRSYIDEARKMRRRPELLTALPPERTAQDQDTLDERQAVRGLLARLPRRQRAALYLRFVEDLSVESVAALMGCSAGTVKSQTFEGLSALRRGLEVSQESEVPNG